MELAASPICFDVPTAPTFPPAPRPLPVFRLPRPSPSPTAPPFARSFPIPSSGRERHRVAEGLEERRVPREAEPEEGPTSRKTSLQRYLDKRKDRFKGKKILGESTSSDIEMMHLIHHNLSCTTSTDLPNLNDTIFSSLPESPQSPTRCSSSVGEKVTIDLNDDGSEN